MFSWLKERWLAQKAFKENDAHPVYGGLHRLLRNIVNDPGEGVYNLTIENKRKICGEIIADFIDNYEQTHPILAIRKRLTHYTANAARDMVLIKTPRESEFPGNTGELRAKLPELVKVDLDLKEDFAKTMEHPKTASAMADLLTARALVFNLWLRAYDYARRTPPFLSS